MDIRIIGVIVGLCVGGCTTPHGLQVRHMPSLNPLAAAVCPPMATYDFAFTSNADGDSEIYLYQSVTRSIIKLTDNDVQDHWATWSPDGRQLAFQSLRDGNREVYVLDVDAGELRNLTQDPAQDLLPAWSPDGSRIAFQSSRDRTWSGEGPLGGHIFVVDPDGEELRRLEMDGFFSTSGIAWSPDGRSLAYARFAEGRQGLYLFDLDTGVESQVLAVDGAAPGLAAYAPSGDALLYYLDHDQGADLFLLRLADSSSQRITDSGRHYYASWSPENGFLLTTSAQDEDGQRYDIRCMAIDGSVNSPVIDDVSDARSAAWRPSLED